VRSIDFAYASLTLEGDNTYIIGPVSDKPDNGYLWHYWIPWLALLDRDRLRLRQLNEVLLEGGPFVFPLEFRWGIIRWMRMLAKNKHAEFLTPHIPHAVLNAARTGRAIILLFFGHEGCSLNVPIAKTKQTQSAYDLLFEFVIKNKLPPEAVWFISGNLNGLNEYQSWKIRRFGVEDAPDAFQARFIEPFSHLAKATWREDERGFEVAVNWEATKSAERTLTHKSTRVALRARPDDIRDHCERAHATPTKLFLCMNRAPRPHRRAIVCHLLRRGFIEDSLVSFHDDNHKDIHFDNPEMEVAWQELQRRQPLVIDRDLPLDFETYYRTNDAAVKLGDAWPYRESCLSIVTETHFSNDVLFISEKIWKPIRNCHPFLIVGTPGTLSHMRQLGFQTFAPAIDERYDSLLDNEERMQALTDVIDDFAALDKSRQLDLLEQLHPALTHNARHLRELETPMSGLFAELDATLHRAS